MRLAQDQRLCRRHDVNIAPASAQQPSGDGRVEWLVGCFERRSHHCEVAGIASVQAGSAWAPVREPPEPIARSGERPAMRTAWRKG